MVNGSCFLPFPAFICSFRSPFPSRPLGSLRQSRHWLIHPYYGGSKLDPTPSWREVFKIRLPE